MASTPSDKDRPNVSLTRAQVSDRLNAMSEALRGVVEGAAGNCTATRDVPRGTVRKTRCAAASAIGRTRMGCTADRNSRSDRFRSR